MDFRNDGNMLFTSPTKYRRSDGSEVAHEEMEGPLMPLTYDVLTWFVAKNIKFKKQATAAPPSTPKTPKVSNSAPIPVIIVTKDVEDEGVMAQIHALELITMEDTDSEHATPEITENQTVKDESDILDRIETLVKEIPDDFKNSKEWMNLDLIIWNETKGSPTGRELFHQLSRDVIPNYSHMPKGHFVVISDSDIKLIPKYR